MTDNDKYKVQKSSVLAFVARICWNSQICYNNSDCNINIAASLRIQLRNKLLVTFDYLEMF